MNRSLRILLISLAALLGLLALGAAVLLARFDADDAKAFVTERVQRETGRTLSLPGKVSLNLFPGLGLQLGEVSLSEPGSAEIFASAKSVHLSLALWPLLSQRLEVGRVQVDGLRARVVRLSDGRTSIDDLIRPGRGAGGGAAPGPSAAAFELNGLAIRDATLTLDDRAARRQLSLSGLEVDLGRLAPGVPADLQLRGRLQADQPALALALDAGGRLGLDPAAGRYGIEALRLAVDGEAAGRPVALKAEGRAALDPDGLQATLNGTLDDSRFQARVRRGSAERAALQADVDLDRLRVAGVLLEQLKVGARVLEGRIELAPLEAQLYGGRTQGTASVDLRGAQPRYGLRQTLSGVQVGPLLKDATGQDRVQGRGDVALQVDTQGPDLDAWRRALAGRAQLTLRDGALRGVNVAQAIRQARAALGKGAREGAGGQSESTDFSELSASFTIARGVAHNEDLQAKSPLLRVTGRGDIDLGAGRIDYLLKATVVDTLRGQGGPELEALKGQTVPVRLSGPLDAMRWRIDLEAMAKEAARRELESRKQEAKEKLKKGLGEQLKGLFGR